MSLLLLHLLKPEKWVGNGKMVGFIFATFTLNNSTATIVNLLVIDAIPSIVCYSN
jgi:hypothetical protein